MSFSTIRLWQLISPALPIGSFSYSQGLEYALDKGWLKTEEEIYDWLRVQMQYGLTSLDLPVLLRARNAWDMRSTEQVEKWNDQLLAFRESAELYDEDCQVGYALRRLLKDLEFIRASEFQLEKTTLVTMYALACSEWEIEVQDSLAGYLWAWCENMVAAAIKLLPMGQTAGQKLLLALGELIPSCCEQAFQIDDDEIGATTPSLAMASAFHETQYSRLFRS